MADNLTVTIDVRVKDKEAKERLQKHSDSLLGGIASLVRDKAKVKVSPGIGPGPHPHRTRHYDTGELAQSLTTYGPYSEGSARVVEIGGDGSVDYGKWLELGWVSRAGNFFRYPWLLPTVKEIIPTIRGLIGRIF